MEVSLSKDYILSLVQKKGWSKAHFADKMGVARQNIDKLLDSQKKDINTIIKISEVLDIPFLRLIGWEIHHKFEGFVKKDWEIKEIKSEKDVLRLLLKEKTIEDLELWKHAFEDSYGMAFSYDKLIEQLTASVEEGDPNVFETYCKIKAKVIDDKEKQEEEETSQ